MRLTGLATVALVVGVLVPSAGAAAAPGDRAPATPPGLSDSTPAASRALAAVEAAFAPKDRAPRSHAQPVAGVSTHVTMLLVDLRRQFDGLSPEDRETAEAFFARPTSDSDEPFGASYGSSANPTSSCSPRVCVHWARATNDAPPPTDSDGDSVPNQVETTQRILADVWTAEVAHAGYRAPLPDGSRGGNSRLDVYLADIGDAGVYGYCAPERRVSGNAFSGYCVLDDDYSTQQFGSHTPLENLKVTAAHEFFHVVQYAYDALEDTWLMESTATWVEDEVYDAINDNHFYLSDSPLSAPHKPLDYNSTQGLHVYGAWIWWRYLSERFPETAGTGTPVLVRKVWEAADSADPARNAYSVQALSQVLAARSQTLPAVYASFSAVNRRPAAFYEEGRSYRAAPLALAPFDLTASQRKVTRTLKLSHLSSKTVAFRPRGAAKTLRVRVDAPSAARRPVAEVVSLRTDGSSRVTPVALDSTGAGSVLVPFTDAGVRSVELVLTNGGHAYTCGQRTSWSCRGTPKDDGLGFTFTAIRRTR